ncbi:hypothetical protein AAK706_08500 [Erysipelotrichaceae bacterium 66-17]
MDAKVICRNGFVEHAGCSHHDAKAKIQTPVHKEADCEKAKETNKGE